jgi:osmotically-inducible protein OsmY
VDATVTAKVKTALALSRQLALYDIEVSTENGVVNLGGRVSSEDVVNLAVAVAGDTRGVKGVESRLVVDPAGRPDSEVDRLGQRVAELELRMRVEDALRPALPPGTGVEVSISGGLITLSGTVESEEARRKLERLAGTATGVEAVRNQIQVAPSSARSALEVDQRLARQVEFELYLTRAMDLEAIEIQSQNGAVTLSGRVGSKAERLLAERIAEDVLGVRAVANRLRVEKAAEGAPE